MTTRSAVRRDRAPTPGAPHPFSVPRPEVIELPGGARLVAAVDRRLPLACVDWVLAAGAHHDRPAQAGRAALTASLLDEGTDRYTGPELSDRIEGLGGALGCGVDWDACYASCSVLAEHLDDAVEMLRQVVHHPTFPEDEVTRCRDQQIARLRQRRDSPSRLAGDRLVAALYPRTPYAAPISGLLETVSSLTRPDLAAFWSDSLLPAEIAVVAVGDLEPQHLAKLLSGGAPIAGERSAPPPVDIPAPDGPHVWIVDRPDAPQTELRVAHPGPPRSHPDWPALKLLSLLLGGTFTSRLMRNLREERGLTYGVSAGFHARKGPGPFVVSTALSTDGAGVAVGQILDELERLRQEPPADDELRDTCDYLIGVVPQRFETVEDTASQLAALAVFDLGFDYFERFESLHRSVTPEQILAAGRRHLHPDHCAIVAVGPATELRPQLKQFGPVEVV